MTRKNYLFAGSDSGGARAAAMYTLIETAKMNGLDPVYCAGLSVGDPRVSVAALCSLHDLLFACESRLVSADRNIVTQEAQNGSGVTVRTEDGVCLPAHSSHGTTSARSSSRRRAIGDHDRGGAQSRAEGNGPTPARGLRRSKAGGQR